MATVLKTILGIFILAGVLITLYGCWEILCTMNFLKSAPERAKGTFTGYYDEEVVSRSSYTNQFGNLQFEDTTSYMSYPQFEFTSKDGTKQRVTESKHHLLKRFIPGQEIEVIVSPHGNHRIAGFYSLYALDLCILVFGLCFIFIPLLIGKVVLPSLQTPAGMEMARKMTEEIRRILSSKVVGPVSVGTILKGSVIFIALVTLFSLGNILTPYIKQMRLGFGFGLIEALEHKRFNEARDLIAQRKGINKVNEYDQSPLLLALEAGQSDLARLLIEAGADVNVKSRMYMTPLRVATQSGDLEMVRLLLAKGASPDVPKDESPPVFYAIAKGYDEIARLLIESNCDLKRSYITEIGDLTVGDMTVLAKKPALTDIVRQRSGSFTRKATD